MNDVIIYHQSNLWTLVPFTRVVLSDDLLNQRAETNAILPLTHSMSKLPANEVDRSKPIAFLNPMVNWAGMYENTAFHLIRYK
jgi:hypothetical protein